MNIDDEKNKVTKIFNTILNTEVSIVDDIDNIEKKGFIALIEQLERAYEIEKNIFENSKLDLFHVTDPLWSVIEGFIQLYYGKNAPKLVAWYIFNRFDDNGNIILLKGKNGEKFTIDNPESLWQHLNLLSPVDLEDENIENFNDFDLENLSDLDPDEDPDNDWDDPENEE